MYTCGVLFGCTRLFEPAGGPQTRSLPQGVMMSRMKRVVLLLILLPATCLGAEPQTDAVQNPVSAASSVSASSSVQAVPSPADNPATEADKTCKAVGGFMAMHWYHATMCTDRHKKLRPRETKIKNAIASAYPAFHAVLTTPPLSETGKYLATGMPYLPDRDPYLTEEGCELNFTVLRLALNDAHWKQAILQCWKQPSAKAQTKSAASQ